MSTFNFFFPLSCYSTRKILSKKKHQKKGEPGKGRQKVETDTRGKMQRLPFARMEKKRLPLSFGSKEEAKHRETFSKDGTTTDFRSYTLQQHAWLTNRRSIISSGPKFATKKGRNFATNCELPFDRFDEDQNFLWPPPTPSSTRLCNFLPPLSRIHLSTITPLFSFFFCTYRQPILLFFNRTRSQPSVNTVQSRNYQEMLYFWKIFTTSFVNSSHLSLSTGNDRARCRYLCTTCNYGCGTENTMKVWKKKQEINLSGSGYNQHTSVVEHRLKCELQPHQPAAYDRNTPKKKIKIN